MGWGTKGRGHTGHLRGRHSAHQERDSGGRVSSWQTDTVNRDRCCGCVGVWVNWACHTRISQLCREPILCPHSAAAIPDQSSLARIGAPPSRTPLRTTHFCYSGPAACFDKGLLLTSTVEPATLPQGCWTALVMLESCCHCCPSGGVSQQPSLSLLLGALLKMDIFDENAKVLIFSHLVHCFHQLKTVHPCPQWS